MGLRRHDEVSGYKYYPDFKIGTQIYPIRESNCNLNGLGRQLMAIS